MRQVTLHLGVTPGLGNNSSLVAFGACKDSRHMHGWGPLSPPPRNGDRELKLPSAPPPQASGASCLFSGGDVPQIVSPLRPPPPAPLAGGSQGQDQLPGQKLAFGRDCVTVWGRARGWGRLGSRHTLTVPVLWDCSFPACPLAPFLS